MRSTGVLSEDEFDAWAVRLSLSEGARAFLGRIRHTPPVRSVSNGAGNMCGRFASRKMGHTVQWESVTGERPLVLLWEHDVDCLEMWDQPWTLKIRYDLPNGKKSGCRTVIDFIVLKREWVGGVDFKTAAELSKLVVEQPHRWVQTGAATWDQPPAREAFKALGLDYRVLSDHDVPHVLVRNIEFLRPRLMREVIPPPDSIQELRERLAAERRLPLTDAILIAGDPDFVYAGHFLRHWYLELRQDALALPDCSWVYLDQLTHDMFACLERSKMTMLTRVIEPDEFELGSVFEWCGRSYQLLNRSDFKVFLQAAGQPLVEFLKPDFRRLLRSEEMKPRSPEPVARSTGLEILKRATPQAISQAIERLKVLNRVEGGTKVAECGVPVRTYYEWKSLFSAAERQYGNGFIGLISRHDLKGNREPRTEESEVELLRKSFEWLRQPVPRETGAGYAYYVALCESAQIAPRSLTSFNLAWNREDTYRKTMDREGKRAAYPSKAPRNTGGAHIGQGPVEGDSPFARVHIDHLQSDTFCRRLNLTQLLGKPWFTIAIDAHARKVIGLWVSILAPSHMSVMMVLRDIVRRFGKLPLMVVTDGGSDFKCKRTARFLAAHRSEHALRPASEPRFGNPIERMNLDVNHHLTKVWLGSNEVLKTPRMSSESHDPRSLAYRTVPQVAAELEKLLFERYPLMWHSGLQCTVQEKLNSAATLQGTSWGIPVPFDERLIFETLAEPHKHGGLVRQRDGISLNGWNYYAEAMVGHDHQKLKDIPLYDPEDPGYIQARIGQRWIRCNLIDSQLRRLPPEGQRRHAVAEQIYLARPSTSKDQQMRFLASLGRMYMEQDAERLEMLAGTHGRPVQSAESLPSTAPPHPSDEDTSGGEGVSPPAERSGLVAAPISRRTDL